MTHTLIGLIAGEAVVNHSRPSGQGLSSQLRRGLLLAVAMIGSNAPDLDLLYTYRGSSTSSLRYVLWHRGYTHTVIGCLALALLLYLGVRAWLAWKNLKPSPRDCGLLLGTAILATALHLGMDHLNSYGVHPFWPAENGWAYGDAVFIVEPLYWVAAAPLFFLLRSLTARSAFAGDRMLDHVLTPLPVNPICWDLLLIETHPCAARAQLRCRSIHAVCARAIPRYRRPQGRPGRGLDRRSDRGPGRRHGPRRAPIFCASAWGPPGAPIEPAVLLKNSWRNSAKAT